MSPSAENSADPGQAFSRTRLVVRDYDLAATLNSGQAFRWQYEDESWHGVIGEHWVRLTPKADGINVRAEPGVKDWHWLRHYLQADVDLGRVLAAFPASDPHLCTAVRACRGLRLLRQDPWECLASFILSSTKQIVQIRQIIELLCRRFGQPLPPLLSAPGHATFPRPEIIASCSESDLRDCKMGFRAPALLNTARRIAEHSFNLEGLVDLPTVEARQKLTELPGVGEKIANCVLLFGFGVQGAFPIDVWILRALRELYFPQQAVTRAEINAFVSTHFGPYAGYAQQYLFHYMRVCLGRPARRSLAPS